MTAPIRFPTKPTAQPFDASRLLAFLGSKPITPEIKTALLSVVDRSQELELAYEQYERNAALTGVPDYSRFKKILPEFAQARRDALIAIGADPDSNDLLPAVPVIFQDA